MSETDMKDRKKFALFKQEWAFTDPIRNNARILAVPLTKSGNSTLGNKTALLDPMLRSPLPRHLP